MTFISLTHACRQLGIDAKTLHRWLAQAQLSLHAHPSDARLKGLSVEHLQQLALAHHRSLVTLPQREPVPASGTPPSLPAAFLMLPETLGALQAQLTAVQQQLADLSLLMQQAVLPPASACDGPVLVEEPMMSPVAARSPKPPPKPAHVLPLVEYAGEGHYVVLCPKQGLLSLEPESPQWFAWVATLSSFRFVGTQGHFTAHREVERVPNGAWRAHRKIRNHTCNLHLGQTQELTMALLEHAAATLQAQLN